MAHKIIMIKLDSQKKNKLITPNDASCNFCLWTLVQANFSITHAFWSHVTPTTNCSEVNKANIWVSTIKLASIIKSLNRTWILFLGEIVDTISLPTSVCSVVETLSFTLGANPLVRFANTSSGTRIGFVVVLGVRLVPPPLFLSTLVEEFLVMWKPS